MLPTAPELGRYAARCPEPHPRPAKNLTAPTEMSAMLPLGLTYSSGSREYPIHYETGVYNSETRRYLREDGVGFRAGSFGDDVGVENGDRVSVVTFGNAGSMFVIFNHSKNKYRFYRSAFKDMAYMETEGAGWIRGKMIRSRLNSEADQFEESGFFKAVLDKIRTV